MADVMTKDKKTWTPREVADATGKGSATIYRHLNSGELPGHKVGGEWKITQRGLREWLGEELFDIYFGAE